MHDLLCVRCGEGDGAAPLRLTRAVGGTEGDGTEGPLRVHHMGPAAWTRVPRRGRTGIVRRLARTAAKLIVLGGFSSLVKACCGIRKYWTMGISKKKEVPGTLKHTVYTACSNILP